MNRYHKIILSLFIAGNLFLSCKKESQFRFTPKPQVIIAANDYRLKSDAVHFVKDTVYVIAANISIDSGHTFLIDAGTLVKVNSGFNVTIQAGATIEAKGIKDEPVIFTLNAGIGSPGGGSNYAWGGILIYGGANGKSSGSITYTRIEFAGSYNASLAKVQSPLSLYNVSNTTMLHHIQVSYSEAASFHFNGGTCNAGNLLSFASGGSDFLIENGYTGNLQNLFAYRYVSGNGGGGNFAGVDIKGEGTEPAITNLTVLGPSIKYGVGPGYLVGNPNRIAALIASGSCRFHVRNAAFVGFPIGTPAADGRLDTTRVRAFYLDSYKTAKALDEGASDFAYTISYQIKGSNSFYIPDNVYYSYGIYYKAEDFKTFLLRPQYHNEIFTTPEQFMFTDPYNYFDGIPDPMPKAGSPLLTGANFEDSAGVFKNTFFKPVNYRGALGTENWMEGWVNFIPLQTDYNN